MRFSYRQNKNNRGWFTLTIEESFFTDNSLPEKERIKDMIKKGREMVITACGIDLTVNIPWKDYDI